MTRARDVANLIGSGNYSSTTFTATAGQTVFSIAHTQNFVQVFMNGLLLDLTVDYTSNGSAVTLTSGAAAGDEIEVVAYNTFSVGDALNQAAADTRYVNASGDTMTGNLKLKSTASTYEGLELMTPSGDGSGEFHIGVHQDGSSAGRGLHFRRGGSDGMDTLSMSIDASGRVTKPSHPSFSAYINGGNPTITSNPTKIPYNAVRWDIGNNFDETNHRYIAPVAGVYHFTVNHNVYGLTDDQYFRTRIYVNAADYAILGYIRARGGGDHTVNDSILINLSAADTVEVYTSSADTSYSLSASDDWNSFSGFLVG